MEVPSDLRYSSAHEWISVEDDIATVGITDFAQQQLGDITFVELPVIGDELEKGQEAAVVESVKAASDIYSPIDGTVLEVNEALEDSPEQINTDPYGDGWLFRVQMSDPGEEDNLLSESEYKALLPSEEA